MELAYDSINTYVEDTWNDDGTHKERLTFLDKAPEHLLVDPGITTLLTLQAANGEVIYEITGADIRGRLLCRKVEDKLAPYIPPGMKP